MTMQNFNTTKRQLAPFKVVQTGKCSKLLESFFCFSISSFLWTSFFLLLLLLFSGKPRPRSEKSMAPHSRTLAWKIPCTEEHDRLQSMRSLRVGHNWATSLSCTGEGNGNPLQCSWLENPRDGGAWGEAVYEVTWSQTQLKRLSSSSSRPRYSNSKGKQVTKSFTVWMTELNLSQFAIFLWLTMIIDVKFVALTVTTL